MAEYENLVMTRGNSQQLVGTLTPAPGRTFATPVSELLFMVKKDVGEDVALSKGIGGGVTIGAESATSISYSIIIDAEETTDEDFENVLQVFVWELKLTEADGWVTTPLSGTFTIQPALSA